MLSFIQSFPKSSKIVKKNQATILVGLFAKGWKRMKNYSISVQEGASVDVRFFFLGSGAHSFPLRCISTQVGKNSSVRMSLRSVLFGSSSIDESTLLTIADGAYNAYAYFSHHILLVSPSARGKTTPSFEIKTDSVHAKHAASVSAIDTEALHYLATRGCDARKAQRMLIRGFLAAEFNSLDHEKTKKELEHKIDSFLQSNIEYVT